MSFFGSFNTPEELERKIANASIALAGKEQFDVFLSKRFPNCKERYELRREKFRTTWTIEPSVLVGLFAILEDNPVCLDYVIAHINPQPNQTLGSNDIDRGLRAIEGKRLMAVAGWVYENADKVFIAYRR